MMFTDMECRAAFVAEMNRKAKVIGMKNTTYTDPTGRGNPSNAYDICRCLLYASGYEKLQEIWNTPEREISFMQKDGTIRLGRIFNKVTRVEKSHLLTDYYNVVGGKGGTLYRTTTLYDGIKVVNDIYNMAVICQSIVNPDDFYAITVMNENGEDNKFEAIKATMDLIESGMNAPIEPPAQHVCVFKVLHYNTRAMVNTNITPVYLKDAFAVCYPASMSKIMTAMLVLDYIPDLHEKVTLTKEDINALPTTSAWYIKDILEGETLTVEELLYMTMLASSNIATEIVSRVVGECILKSKNL